MVPVLKREIHNGHFSRPHVVCKNSTIISFLMTLELQIVTFKEDSAHRDDPLLGFKRVEDDDYHTTRGRSQTKKRRTTTTLQDLPDERRRVDRFGQQDICHSFACFELTFIDVNFNESPLDAPVGSVATNTGS